MLNNKKIHSSSTKFTFNSNQFPFLSTPPIPTTTQPNSSHLTPPKTQL